MTDGEPGAGRSAPLGILAGSGPLPIEIAEAGARQGRPIHIVAIDGFAHDAVARFPHERVSIGEVGRILNSFRRSGVREIVIAGAMTRPNLLRIKIDSGFITNLPTVLSLTKGGDDSVLRRVVRFFEGHGLVVLGAGEVAPELLAPKGSLALPAPVPGLDAVLLRAAALMNALAPFDIGQGVVARADGIIAVEGVRGTDAMLADLGQGGAADGRGTGGVLLKLAKRGQEMRIDLPTIGPETVRRAKAAGLAGIAVGAGAAIVLERERLVAEAEDAGLFVIGIETPEAAAGLQGAAGAAATQTDAAAPLLRVAARRAPTPGDRRDTGIGRRLMAILRAHGAGPAAIVSREHVHAVAGRVPLAAFVAAQGRPATWGWRALRGRLGILMIDGSGLDEDGAMRLLDADLMRAAMETGLAGIVLLGALPQGEAGAQLRDWANEARVFLMAEVREEPDGS